MFGPALVTVFPATMVFLSVTVPVFSWETPPPLLAVLPVIVLAVMFPAPCPLVLLNRIPPPRPELPWFVEMVELVTLTVPRSLKIPPPPPTPVLLLMVLRVTLIVPVLPLKMPPPKLPAEFPLIVLSITVTAPVPPFLIPPATLPAVLFVIVLFVTIRVPGPLLPLLMAPASLVAELPVMSVLLMLTVPVLLLWMQPRLVAEFPVTVPADETRNTPIPLTELSRLTVNTPAPGPLT